MKSHLYPIYRSTLFDCGPLESAFGVSGRSVQGHSLSEEIGDNCLKEGGYGFDQKEGGKWFG